MTKRQDLYLQRRSRPEQSDQRQPNQAANISHRPRASPDSTSLASRIEFPTMTHEPTVERSMKALSVGLPGLEKSSVTPRCRPKDPSRVTQTHCLDRPG